MSTRKTRLQKLEERLGASDSSKHYEEWQCVITLGGKNPGTHLVHRVTGEECRDSVFVKEVFEYNEPQWKGKPLTFNWQLLEVELVGSDSVGGNHAEP